MAFHVQVLQKEKKRKHLSDSEGESDTQEGDEGNSQPKQRKWVYPLNTDF